VINEHFNRAKYVSQIMTKTLDIGYYLVSRDNNSLSYRETRPRDGQSAQRSISFRGWVVIE
jgi:hypothetical protein